MGIFPHIRKKHKIQLSFLAVLTLITSLAEVVSLSVGIATLVYLIVKIRKELKTK